MIMVEFDRSQHAPHRPGGHYAHAHAHPHVHAHAHPPHLQHLDHPSARSTPSPPYQYAALPQMPQHAPPVRTTPTSYPSPASYPSPSMPAYQFPPQQQQQQPPPPGRGSPYAQPAAINLPPIRLNPPPVAQLQPAAPLHEGSPVLGSPLHPPQYYHPAHGHALPPPAMSHHQITSSPIHQPLRYPIPSVGNNERIMSGGRHKKEIKRRTKTGCLTCRKRRIKCDEGHPTCKNCQKSKRDCLGYDPIFKPQPGPAAIQPAPAGVGHSYSQTASTASSPVSSCDTYDFSPVDPSLDGPGHPSAPSSLLDSPATYRPELKRTFDRTSPFSSASETARTPYTPIPRSATPSSYIRQQDSGNSAKRIKIDDLLSVGSMSNPVPPPLSPPTSELAASVASTAVESTKSIYKSRYAPAVDEFLETTWFTTRGLQKIWSDVQFTDVMSEVFERLKARGGSYVDEEDPCIRRSGKDSEILWAAIKMCYGTKIPVSDNRREEERNGNTVCDEEGAEVLRRIAIVESLVTGIRLESEPPSPKSQPTSLKSTDPFWATLGRLVSVKNEDIHSEREIRDLLDDCHEQIKNSQSRHLLFSIVEWQHLRGGSSEHLRERLRDLIENVARSRAAPMNCLKRRIAGRAMGLWGIPVTETPFCMPAV